MALKRTKTPATAADLAQQRAAFQSQLSAIDAAIAGADPLDVDGAAALYARRQALVGAVAEVSRRIQEQQRIEASQRQDEREVERSQRATLARSALDDAARNFCKDLDALSSGTGKALDVALAEAAACGGYPSPAAIIAVNVRQAIGNALAGWQRLAQPPEDKQALALADRTAQLQRAEARLVALREQRKKSGKPGVARVSDNLLENAAHAVAAARRSLLLLATPPLDDDALFTEAYRNLPELSEWVGSHWERVNAEKRKEQRKAELQEQANAALVG